MQTFLNSAKRKHANITWTISCSYWKRNDLWNSIRIFSEDLVSTNHNQRRVLVHSGWRCSKMCKMQRLLLDVQDYWRNILVKEENFEVLIIFLNNLKLFLIFKKSESQPVSRCGENNLPERRFSTNKVKLALILWWTS